MRGDVTAATSFHDEGMRRRRVAGGNDQQHDPQRINNKIQHLARQGKPQRITQATAVAVSRRSQNPLKL